MKLKVGERRKLSPMPASFFNFRMRLQDVETDGELDIGRVDQHHVVNPVGGDDSQYLVNQIAVRVKDSDTVTILNVLPDQIQQQR